MTIPLCLTFSCFLLFTITKKKKSFNKCFQVNSFSFYIWRQHTFSIKGKIIKKSKYFRL